MKDTRIHSLSYTLMLTLAALILCGSSSGSRAAQPIMQLGIGANYWRALDDTFDQSFEKDGLGWLISARFLPDSLIHFGLELERSPSEFTELEKRMYAPSAYLILGRSLYAAVGAGFYYYDGSFYSDPFYVLRAGFVTQVLPSIFLDINANYRFEQINKIRDEFKNVDTDTVTLGAALRLQF